MKPSRRTRSLPTSTGLLALLLLLAACSWGGHTFRSDTLAEGSAPGPTLIVRPWLCGGEPYTGNDNLIIVETATAKYALAEMDAHVAALEPRGPANLRAPSGICRNLRPQWVREGDRMVPASWAREVSTATGAASILVMSVDTTWKCTNEGENVGGTFIAFGISRCYESRTTLAAAVVDTEGRVLWSAFRSEGMTYPDQTPPQAQLGVAKLLEELPIASTTPG